MRGKIVAASIAAVLGVVGVAGAATSVVGVPSSSLEGVKNAVSSDGSLKANAVGHAQIRPRSITRSQIALGTLLRGPRGFPGATGPAGPAGPAGPTGAKGDTGAASIIPGPVGPKGDKGDQGIPGTAAAKGDKGDTGAQGPRGFTGDTGPAGPTGAASTVPGPKGDKGAVGDTGPAGPTGSPGSPGAAGMNGAPGVKGDKGDTGAAGTPGAKGDTGAPGATGAKGDKGDTGATGPQGVQGVPGTPAPTVDYGIVNVNVQRGTGAVTTWAQYTTPLGSPVGGSTGGSFRFTCSTANAPCKISVQAAVEGSNTAKTHTFYPRLIITRDGDGNGGGSTGLTQCEYADGGPGAAPVTLTNQGISPTPTFSNVSVNIGGSYDCDPGQAFFGSAQAAGDVATVQVPNGYYDVNTSAAFGS